MNVYAFLNSSYELKQAVLYLTYRAYDGVIDQKTVTLNHPVCVSNLESIYMYREYNVTFWNVCPNSCVVIYATNIK